MKLCLGTVQFGMNYGIQGNKRPDKSIVREMLEYACSHRIDILDTAAAYGDAEDIIGNLLKEDEKLASLGVVSKLKPNAFENEEPSIWREVAIRNAEESRKKLGKEQLYAYLFHNAAYIFDPRAVDALNTVRENQIAERIGVSIYTPSEALKALEYECIKAIQIPYNVFDHRFDQCGFFEKAKQQDVVVFARSSLLQGLLMMNPDNLPARIQFAKPYLQDYQRICKKYNRGLLETAVSYVGNHPQIDYVVFGVDNKQQLEEYVSIQHSSLPEAMISELKKVFAQVEEKLVNPSMWGKE